jgi:N-acyl-L-homoserine lactone synthetase
VDTTRHPTGIDPGARLEPRPASTGPAYGARIVRAAEQVLAGLAPLGFRVATTSAQRETAYRLRYRCVIEQGWAGAEEFPDGLERDEHDERAIQILAWDGATVVGTIRLVTPVPGAALPIEAAFDLRVEPVGRVVDGGRLVVASECRADLSLKVLRGLLTRLWLEAHARGYDAIAATAPARLAVLYRRLGVQVEVLGPARFHWGEERLPLLLAATPESMQSVRLRPPITPQQHAANDRA